MSFPLPLKNILKNPESFSALLIQTAMKTLGTQIDILGGAPYVINEIENKTYIYADLPGVDPENICIHFSNNNLTITATRPKPEEVGDEGTIRYGNIKLDIALAFPVINKKNVQVLATNGVVSIIIDRSSEQINDFTINCST